ncbi:hypothetical protein [Cytobacillus gottheilii]|nr:hypothetical protein [Cytobacillus gottheilii]
MYKKIIMIIVGSVLLFVGSGEISNKVNDYVSIDGFTTKDFPDQH